MDLRDTTEAALQYVRAHQSWGVPIVFLLAFGESLAFISLLLPATVILFGVGALIGEAHLAFSPLWLSAAAGAALEDWLSFWIGLKLKSRVAHVWPLTRYPDLIQRGHRFFLRWGAAGIFVGRFFGPLRASVPLVAGICEMDRARFQVANVSSALVWAAGILVPGAFGIEWLRGLL